MKSRKYYYITFEGEAEAIIEEMAAHLLDVDILCIGSSEDNKQATLYVNRNDYFVPAADAESISYSEIEILFELIKEKGEIGVYEFVANKTNIPNKHWREKESWFANK